MDKIKIYLATSWKNEFYNRILKELLLNDYNVYDFRNPESSFSWNEIDINYEKWNINDFVKNLENPLAIKGFLNDFKALEKCNVCILILPSGLSSHLEFGFAIGKGKIGIIYSEINIKPELMYGMTNYFVFSISGLLNRLKRIII